MACLLKLPLNDSKGVVTFTTQEWRIIAKDSSLLAELHNLRTHYVTGLHFNWHDYSFSPSPLFDFFMAGEGDLRTVDGTPYVLLPMDACNFTPACYTPQQSEKFWDVLAVGNPVSFKRPEQVLRTIRRLFDESTESYRALYICPIPTYSRSDEVNVLYDVREYYEALFSPEERTRFTLLTTQFDSPNPFDRTTLSVFFKNSKVFLHCATEERRCRIAAYAWCAGLPVVSYPSVASILPAELRTQPGYFEVDDDEDYVPQLQKAIIASSEFLATQYQQELSEIYTIATLKAKLEKLFRDQSLTWQGDLLTRNLDRRLGWHHNGIGGGANGLEQPLSSFMQSLLALKEKPAETARSLAAQDYPERTIANELLDKPLGNLKLVEEKSIYLNQKKRRWVQRVQAITTKLRIG
jgi:hypothetical protein